LSHGEHCAQQQTEPEALRFQSNFHVTHVRRIGAILQGRTLNASANRQMNPAVSAGDPESRPGENWCESDEPDFSIIYKRIQQASEGLWRGLAVGVRRVRAATVVSMEEGRKTPKP
jgi:hypothetical protein